MIQQIETRYDPENDTRPDGPPVTWAEYDLFCAFETLHAIVETLGERVKDLEEKNKELEQAARDAMTLASGESLE